MGGVTKSKGRRFFRLRLATLFWLTLSAACFFAGKNWESLSEALTRFAFNDEQSVHLRPGESTVLKSSEPIPIYRVFETKVCNPTPISQNEIKVEGLRVGKTAIHLWNMDHPWEQYEVVVRP